MRLHDLKAPKGPRSLRSALDAARLRLGKTSTAGTRAPGQGSKNKTGFEGGQMPLQRRIPKVGFRNPFRKEYAV